VEEQKIAFFVSPNQKHNISFVKITSGKQDRFYQITNGTRLVLSNIQFGNKI